MSIRTTRAVLTAGFVLGGFPGVARAQAPRFEVTISRATRAEPVTGRLIVVIAKNKEPEPRYQVSPSGAAMAAVDLEQVAPEAVTLVDGKALGYPGNLSELPAGKYWVQAIINVYQRVTRSDGHTIWVPFNDGRQAPFQVAEGNLYSTPVEVDVGAGSTTRLTIDQVVPREPDPVDNEWVRHFKVQSQKLSAFWGRPVFIHATALLPRGYATETSRRYATVYTLGHNVPFNFSTDSARVRGRGTISPVTGVETGYDFYLAWNSDSFPRMVAISFEQQTPFFPDGYSVNSANNGPYGDAVVEEVIPYLEKQLRLVSAPAARLVEGASTGGWSALNLQLRHPDFFGGAWVLQPDPIDFRRYQLVNIYEDANAFTQPLGAFNVAERPFRRSVEGQVVWTARQLSRFEEVLGTKGRSGFQLEAWEANYGPVGSDGYPKALWDKLTGAIDKDVATYMKEKGYDLREYAERNWSTLGPKLAGKLHLFSGDMDDFYLNLAVYRFEEFAKATKNPVSDATFTYGRPMKGHAWHAFPWAELVRQMDAHVKRNGRQ
ncbi:MAG TPA: alpha/beta hydrolase-fold protein [Gemmatimonadales bacterium]|nr:alpha/beta hydrolase-fold protein [Gemmatimonadales bacterium]